MMNVGDGCGLLADIVHAGTERTRIGVTRLLLGLVRLYQVTLSPILGGQCRFHPTCSDYALYTLASHGPGMGAWLALKRLLKCHPFHPGGFDPPPPGTARGAQ